MGTCASCGATTVAGSDHERACPVFGAAPSDRGLPPPPAPPPVPPRGPTTRRGAPTSGAYAFDLPPNRTNQPWAPPLPAGDAPATSTVDAFDDGLAPFFGDPTKSRVLGKLLQVAAGLLALYSLARAGGWLYFASLTSDPLAASQSLAQQQRVLDAGRFVDSIDVYFWPTIIALLVIDLLWRRARRPKELLAARGEAYVEATITRVVPITYRVVGGVLLAGGFLINISQGSTKNLRPAQVSSYAMTRAISSVVFAIWWAMFIGWVWLSEAHLAKRVAKAADPTLAGYSVPYVVPEKDPGAFGSTSDNSEGAGWLLRTAGLLIGGLFGFFGVIAGLSGLGKDPLPAAAILVVSAVVLGLVVWAFVRRRRRRRTPTGAR